MSRWLVLWGLVFANPAAAMPILVNGSLTGPIANSTVPTGWTITSHSPDTMDENNNLGVPALGLFGATPSPSPDGGTWVGLFMVGTTVEKFEQSVSGFSIGQAYELSWYHSNFGYDFSTNDVAIEVFVDGSSVGVGPTRALGTAWYSESVSFVATSTTHTIEIGSAGTLQAYHGIDGIAIAELPEPAVSALLCAALGCAAAIQRRRQHGGTARRVQDRIPLVV